MIHLERYFNNNKIPDITYIGIGSACVRDSKPENMQQFPPWLETQYTNSNKTFCLINIDPKFESPYLLTHMLPIQEDEKTSSPDGLFKVFETDRLVCIYINEAFDYYNWVDNTVIEKVVQPLDIINNLVMSKSKLLICGVYTGASNDILEKYFKSKYSCTDLFDRCITYNFMDDGYGSCMVDLTTNFPLIDYQINQIVKLDLIIKNLDLETIKCIYGSNIYGLEQKIINWSINKLKQLPNIEMYLYRNYLNRNFQPIMEPYLKISAFADMNLLDYDNFDTNINKMLELIIFTYYPYINILKLNGIETSDIFESIHSITTSSPQGGFVCFSKQTSPQPKVPEGGGFVPFRVPSVCFSKQTSTNIYTWISNYTRLINLIAEKHLK